MVNHRLFVLTAALAAGTLSAQEKILKRWDFDSGTDGWAVITQCELSARRGVLEIRGTGNDPHCRATVEGPAGWKKLTLKTRFNGRRNAQLFWTTKTHPGTAESRSVRFQMRGNADGFREQVVYFRTESPLTSIRLDPHSAPGQVLVDSIVLAASAAPPADPATDPSGITVPPGFEVELLYSVPAISQGSWVSMTIDPRGPGRLFACDQYGGLYHVTTTPRGEKGKTQVKRVPVKLGGAQGMVWAFDSLYVVLNSAQAQGPGLYRVTDSNDDGQVDKVSLLKALKPNRPGTEHGPHAVILGPDQKSLYVVGGNMTALPEPLTKPTRHQFWEEDQLLPRGPASNGHATGLLAPGGWVCKTDAEGKSWELVGAGFRNPYDIAFNREGELFTYDADMEMDVGTAWYRATRVCHVVSGGEFGWRYGTGKWPAYYPDSVAAVADIGLGSPTGVTFGYRSRFPLYYQEALFINDWTNGRMFAVHLKPHGGTYQGTAEPFITGSPLPLTDVAIHPADGAMYFTIGGRRTQSGLYRVSYTGPIEDVLLADYPAERELRRLRRQLETYHGTGVANMDLMWRSLSHDDRSIRYAARVGLEHVPYRRWISRAFSETKPDAVIQSMIALARANVQTAGGRVIDKLNSLDWDDLSARQRADLLRAHALAFMRMGESTAEKKRDVLSELTKRFPSDDRNVNHELCRVLVYLQSPQVAAKALPLMEAARTQEDRLFYAMTLRSLKSGWDFALRKRYFDQLNACETAAAVGDYVGGGHFQTYVQIFRKDAAANLTEADRAALKSVIEAKIATAFTTGSPTPRKFVKQWKAEDLTADLPRVAYGRSFSNGQSMYRIAACVQCHRFDNVGGIFGPDLTKAAKRYSRAVLLREIIQPSKQVSDQYQAHTIRTTGGKIYTGRILNEDARSITLATDPLKPAHVVEIARDDVDAQRPAKNSLMPLGLLNTLTKEDILDLLAFIESGGDPKHSNFSKQK